MADEALQDKIDRELPLFKKAEDTFGMPIAVRNRTTKAPGKHIELQ